MTSEELEHQELDAQDSSSNTEESTPADSTAGSTEVDNAEESSATETPAEASETTDKATASESEKQAEPKEDAPEESTSEETGDTEDTPDPDAESDAEAEDTPDSDEKADAEAETNAEDKEETTDADAVTPEEAGTKKRHPKMKKVLLVFAAVLLIILAGCCVALAVDDNNRMQAVPETTMLDEQVDISGLTQDELVALLEERAKDGIASTVTLSINGTGYDIDLLDVGTLDYADTTAQAFAPYNSFILARWGSRAVELVTGNTGKYDTYTAFDIDHAALKACVEEIAKKADTKPKNAGYDFDSETRKLVTTPPVDGIELDVDATVAAIEKSIVNPTDKSNSRFVVQGVATVTAPDVLEPGQAILVDTRACRVYLYEVGEEVISYACTPGQSGYATPKGNFYLEYKDAAPTWINPHSAWSEDMPETIGPGASNPLGLRALAVSCGGGIYIHGTTNTGGLGYPGSHGCVRLSNTNIIDLFDRVSTGIPIIIR